MKSKLSCDSEFKIKQVNVCRRFFCHTDCDFFFFFNHLDACICSKDMKLPSKRVPCIKVVGGPMQPLKDGAQPCESVDKCHFLWVMLWWVTAPLGLSVSHYSQSSSPLKTKRDAVHLSYFMFKIRLRMLSAEEALVWLCKPKTFCDPLELRLKWMINTKHRKCSD